MSGDEVLQAVDALRGDVARLLDADLVPLDAAGIAGLAVELETVRRQLDAVDVRVISAAQQAGVPADHARGSTPDFLVHTLRLSAGEAHARTRRAGDLAPRRTLTGEPLEPIHPVIAAAQREGAVSGQQIDIMTKALGKIPADIAVEATPVAERMLVDAARHESPRELTITAKMLLERLDPDGTQPDDEENYRRRDLHLTRKRNGSWTFRGELTDENGLVWQTILDALSAPVPADANGEPDGRTAGQRRHDAMREAGERLLRSGTLPDAGGTPVTILFRTTPADLADPDGLNQTAHGDVMRTSALFRMAGDAELTPLLFDRAASDCELMLGRTKRLANRAQRRALALRDGGCCFPGCTRPATWCEVHHVIEWAKGGLTDVDKMCLMCPFHHREFERRGWIVVMIAGLPHWIPPRWIDPTQTPRQNTVHHLPEIIFGDDGTLTARR